MLRLGLLFITITALTGSSDPTDLVAALRKIMVAEGCPEERVRVAMVMHPGKPLEISVSCKE